MAKICTDINQSKQLAKILPIESADMFWLVTSEPRLHVLTEPLSNYDRWEHYPAWSLSALLDVLPNNKKESSTLSRGGWKIEPIEYIDKWFCEYEDEVDEDSPCKSFSVSADNPVDACYEMIVKLRERNLL